MRAIRHFEVEASWRQWDEDQDRVEKSSPITMTTDEKLEQNSFRRTNRRRVNNFRE